LGRAAQRLGWVGEFRAVARACDIFRRNSIWNIALYVQPKHDLPPVGEPHKVFLNKRFWRGPKHVHTRADPFLFVHQGELFLLNEAMVANGPGWIEGYKTQDLRTFSSLGAILREPGHLSYPIVFGIGSDIFMIPESVYAQEVRLYRFEDFPKRPRKVRSLLIGDYVDTSPVKVDEIWFVFTTSLTGGLELFFTDDIIHGVLTPHPKNPITTDPRFRRCGGVPINLSGKLYRLAQNCAHTYGGNLTLMEIRAISRTEYEESPVKEDIFNLDQSWNSEGSHHASVAMFHGQTVVAVDGKQPDHFLIHKVVQGLDRLVGRHLRWQ
jgi:hypothetical protein